jgi:CHAT domain-containing protein
MRIAFAAALLVVFAAMLGAQPGSLTSPGSGRSLIDTKSPQLWSIRAAAGQLISADFDQSQADLAIVVRGPSRGELGRFDFSQFGPEPVEFVAPAAGVFTLEVRAHLTLRSPAQYRVTIAAARTATEDDLARMDAERLISSARRAGDRATAESLAAAADECRRAILYWQRSANERMEAYAHVVLADAQRSSGRIAEATLNYGAAEELARGAGDALLLGEAINKLGGVELNLGQIEAANLSYGKALDVWQKAGFQYGTMAVLNNRALLKTRTGEWNSALQDFQALLRSPELTDTLLRAAAENNIGLVYEAVGSWPQAETHFQTAAALWNSAADRTNRAKALINLGRARLQHGASARSLGALQEAVALLRTSADESTLALAYNVRGQARMAVSGSAEAKADLARALESYHKTGDRRGAASALHYLGLLETRLGDYAEAGRHLQEALDLRVAVGLRDEQASTLYALALLDKRQERWDESAGRLESALSLAETLRTSLAAPRYRMTYVAERHHMYEDLADLYVERNDLEKALATIERGRARQWLEDLQTGETSPDPEGRRRALELRLNYQLDQLVRLGGLPESKVSKDLVRSVDRLIEEYRDLDRATERKARTSEGFAEPALIDPHEIPGLLGKDSILLYYAVADERSHLFLVTADRIRQFDLPGRAELERLGGAVRKLLPAFRERQLDGAAEQRLAGGLRRLSQTLLGPVADALAGTRRAIVAADDVLQYISFAALTAPGEKKPLGVLREIVTIPSASVWRELRSKLRGRGAAPRSVAVFADPVFDAGDGRLGTFQRPQAPSLSRLSYATREAQAIAQQAPSRDAYVVTGFDASLGTLQQIDLSQFRVVHFATHAAIHDADPERSGITLSLVRPNGKPQPGFASAGELAKLRLASDLFVLSGCETAIGPLVRGEGMVSLARPLFRAGTRAVLATLWPVEDEASAAFMKEYYRVLLRENGTPASALRAAQESLWRTDRWKDPFFWSGYTLLGDSK